MKKFQWVLLSSLTVSVLAGQVVYADDAEVVIPEPTHRIAARRLELKKSGVPNGAAKDLASRAAKRCWKDQIDELEKFFKSQDYKDFREWTDAETVSVSFLSDLNGTPGSSGNSKAELSADNKTLNIKFVYKTIETKTREGGFMGIDFLGSHETSSTSSECSVLKLADLQAAVSDASRKGREDHDHWVALREAERKRVALRKKEEAERKVVQDKEAADQKALQEREAQQIQAEDKNLKNSIDKLNDLTLRARQDHDVRGNNRGGNKPEQPSAVAHEAPQPGRASGSAS